MIFIQPINLSELEQFLKIKQEIQSIIVLQNKKLNYYFFTKYITYNYEIILL